MGDPIWTVHQTLIAKGFTFVRPVATYRGEIRAHGLPATVEIEIPDFRFATLPIVRLLDRTQLPITDLAHLLTNGGICYVGEAGLPLDLYDPGGSVLRVLEEVATTLERSFAGGAEADFTQELSSYWRGKSLYSIIPRATKAKILEADLIAADAIAALILAPRGRWDHLSPATRVPALALVFPTDLRHSDIFPPKSLAEALAYVAQQSGPPQGWHGAVLRATAQGRAVFLVARNAIMGWEPEFSGRLKMVRSAKRGFREDFFVKMVDQHAQEVGLDRMTAVETDLRFCVQRNLIDAPTLIGKKIALVGCGTIGSNLAKMLVQAGTGADGTLSLYDTDRLSPGNLGRHLLGYSDLGKSKASAVAAYLSAFHPDVRVSANGVDATREWEELEKADLIIDATGDPNVASALNDLWLRSDRTGTQLALLHSWVFGNGVAGQSFLNLKDGNACYRCLRTGFDGNYRFNPLRDPQSQLRLAPASCGEAGYIPYAVDAPVATASLALRAVLDWAGGNPGARMRTVVLNQNEGRENVKWATPAPYASCVACRG